MTSPLGTRLFVERRSRSELGLRRGAFEAHLSFDAGGALEEESAAGLSLRWEEASTGGPVTRALQTVAERLRDEASPPPDLSPFEGPMRQWAETARAHGAELDVLLRVHDQRMAAGARETPRFDRRHWVQLELRCRIGSGPAQRTSLRELAFATLAELQAADLSAAVDEVIARTRLKEIQVAPPEGPITIVLPSGADAGVLFHEVCGHPLEGDVVLRRASFLASRMGEQVAPDFVTIVDSPLEGSGGLSFQCDDEGELATEVKLIDRGAVAGALNNRRTAGRLGTTSNGHARRASFRDAALPRMSHTAVRPHQGSDQEILATVERGLWVSFLTPRAVHLMPGDFAFHIPEARLIENGRLGAFVGPGLLEGNGLDALRGIEAVGAEARPFFGLKGCGKLDQGGLPVSFGNPILKLGGLRVRGVR